MSLFKAYDIRGTIPDELNEEVIARIARAFAVYLDEQETDQDKKLSVVVGRDNRATSERFAQSAIATLREQGVDVIDIGLASTPYFYYASAFSSCSGGIMITASHNPPQYNGCKLVSRQGSPIGADSGLPHIEALFEKNVSRKDKAYGGLHTLDILSQYVEESIALAGGAGSIKPLTVVVDTGNGVSSLMCEALFKKLPCRLVPLFFELDGNFPHHMPNPLEEKNTVDLRKRVKEENADIGIAMDADGDRVIFIDEQGNAVSSDIITALLATDILTRTPQSRILYDLRSSHVVRETIHAHGGYPQVTRVGHAFIKKQMEKESAVFAGELSGHFYYKFGEYGYFEASLATIVQMLRLLSSAKKPFSKIIEPFQRYYSTGEVNFSVEDKKAVLDTLEKSFADADRIDKLDGLTLEYKDWWCNVRPSNTENLLRLVLEAKTSELRNHMLEKLRSLIERQ